MADNSAQLLMLMDYLEQAMDDQAAILVIRTKVCTDPTCDMPKDLIHNVEGVSSIPLYDARKMADMYSNPAEITYQGEIWNFAP